MYDKSPMERAKTHHTLVENFKRLFKRPIFQVVYTSKAPEPVGPYSQAVRLAGGRFLVCSGQIAIDPDTNKITGSNITEQSEKVFQNTLAILRASKMDWQNVFKTSVFLKDMNGFEDFNEVYRAYFKDLKPARSLVEVTGLPKEALVEMEVWAVSYSYGFSGMKF